MRLSFAVRPGRAYLLAALIFCAFQNEAKALSCPQPTPGMLLAGDEPYQAIEGSVNYADHFAATRSNEDARLHPDQVWTTIAHIRGVDLSDGTPFDQKVSVERICISVWCGAAQDLDQVLIFLSQPGPEPVLQLSPCGGRIFAAGTYDADQVRVCLTGPSCPD